jgi:hypothetical protein
LTPKPKGYYRKRARMLEARVKSLECELDAVRTELQHAIETMPPKRLEKYTREREARGGPLP